MAGAVGVHVEGGRRFAPGKEVGSKCNREGLWQYSTGGGAVGYRGEDEKIQGNC